MLAVAPLLLAVALTARELGLGRDALYLTLRHRRRQILIALLGLPLGFLAYGGLRPAPLGGVLQLPLGGGAIAVAIVSLSVLAFAEELLFRGVLQPLLIRVHGRAAGIAVTAALSGTVVLGTRSLPYGAFAALVAGGFGLACNRTGSIAGTSAARALMLIGLLVVWPLALG
jgi:membrane protease YdiL (CAAX protease family)